MNPRPERHAAVSRTTLVLGLALGLAGSACSSRDIVAASPGGDAGGGGGSGASFCEGSGPPILLGDGITISEGDGNPDSVCTGEIAVRAFERALCTCEGYATSTMLQTDSFDSVVGPYAPGGASGDVGVNGELRTNAVVTVSGGLAVAGAAGAVLLADLHVTGDLEIGGALGNGVAVTSGGNVRVAGNVNLANLDVTGTLTVPETQTISGGVTAGTTVRAPVTVAPPCACDNDDLVDLEAFIAAHVTDNQDAAIGLAPDALTDYDGAVSLDLPCGIYYVGPVRGNGALTLRVSGRVALLVDGDLSLTAPFTVELVNDDAELDLMVGGLLSSGEAVVIGRADHPARTRVYIGGEGTINLAGDSQLAANLYAPRASVALSGGATVFGSLFVRRLDQSAPIAIHYDVDVRRADVGCPVL